MNQDIEKKVDTVWRQDFRNKDPELKELLTIIIKARRNVEDVSDQFQQFMAKNLDKVLSLNSRWLISIMDTYIDYGNEIEKSNALFVTAFFNNYKMFHTYLDLVENPKLAPNKIKKYRSRNLWDGMRSFNVHQGDMYENLINRAETVLKDTLPIYTIWKELLKRASENNTVLSDLKSIHNRGLYKKS